MFMHPEKLLHITLLLLLSVGFVFAQTTGKIAGVVRDQETGRPMPGVNIVIEGTNKGAATDADGRFFIINVPPGKYNLMARMIGYSTMKIEGIRVNVNSTTNLTFELSPEVIEGDEIVVTAKAISMKKDQTSSVRTVSTEEMEVLPVENVSEVVSLQAGVVHGHFRGGRDTEVSYMIDGMMVNNAFNGNSQSTVVDVDVVQELEVITGTFNAEYGQAMSGIVNAVTKDGSSRWSGSVYSSYANFLTRHNDIFVGLGNTGAAVRNSHQDYKVQLEGPLVKEKLFLLANYRFQDNPGHLNGIRRFNPTDYNEYIGSDPSAWHTESTGDGAYVAMNTQKFHNFFGKLSYKPSSMLKFGALFSLNDRTSTFYNHTWKYNPDPLRNHFNRSVMGALTMNHMMTSSLFYDVKLSYNNQDMQSYLYEGPTDERYLSPYYRGRGQTGFVTGGDAGPGKSMDAFSNYNAKVDLYWQLNSNHAFKTGILATRHEIRRDRVDVRNIYQGTARETETVVDPETGKIDYPFYELEIVPKTEETLDVYTVHPIEFSTYIQDKMEFESLVINLGVRYDYFDPEQVYPSDRRNPGNQLVLPDSMMSSYPQAPPKYQFSPRFGLAYQLGDEAVLRFSYGHFFQMPAMHAMYQNNVFRVPTNDYGITMGNTLLDAQRTVTYEIGLWQQLFPGMSLELALYYKDIYNLLSTTIISTYNQIEYGLFTNKDYGNARGLEVKWDYQIKNFYTGINYTLSYTKGNADNPWQTFNRAGQSRDPIRRYIPMSWDQRHTFNMTVGYNAEKYGATVIGFYNSGTPYTYTPLGYSELSLINLYENNDFKPGHLNADLRGYWRLPLGGQWNVRLLLNIYNLFDALIPMWVYGDTGKPYEKIVTDIEKMNYNCDFTDVFDQYQNPTAYAAPRMVKLGLEVQF